MTVMNITDKLLPFSFTSNQSYDFAVIEAATGQEIWRWSETMFFSSVKRSEAIRANGEWKFEATWNRRDRAFDPVAPGAYRVVGYVTTEPAIESPPVAFEIP
jgi:hypothetical protein